MAVAAPRRFVGKRGPRERAPPMTPVLFCLFVALLGGSAFDLVIEPFEAAASMNAMSGTPEDWDSYGINSSLTLTDSGQALQVNYTVEQAQSWGGAVIFDRPAQSQANFDCSTASHISFRMRVTEAQSAAGRAQLRLVLYDASDCAADCTNGNNVELYYAFFDVLSVASEWAEYTVDLQGGRDWSNPFVLTGWSGIYGNEQLDPRALSFWLMEISIDDSGSLGSLSSGAFEVDRLACAGMTQAPALLPRIPMFDQHLLCHACPPPPASRPLAAAHARPRGRTGRRRRRRFLGRGEATPAAQPRVLRPRHGRAGPAQRALPRRAWRVAAL